MNCQDALRLLYDIIDREASQVDTQEVQRHLEKCRHCSDVYRVERQVHDFILAKATKDNPQTHLDHLKSRVLGLLEQEDRAASDPFASGGGPDAASPAPLVRIGRFVAAAAALVILVWTAFVVSDLFHHQAAYYSIEQQHFAAERAVAQFASGDVTDRVLGECSRGLRYQVSSQVATFELMGGRMETVDETEMAHFLYRCTEGGSVVSVFVIPVDQFEIPEDVKQYSTVRDGRVFYDHNCRGCRMVYHQNGKVVVITACQDRNVDLLEFIPGSSAV
jgi:anti-sigma factor (TIGR02949 family)